MTFRPIPLNFLIYEGKLIFFFFTACCLSPAWKRIRKKNYALCAFELALSPSHPLLSNIHKECTYNAQRIKIKRVGRQGLPLKGQQREMVFRLNLSHIVQIERIKKIFHFVLLLTEIYTLLGLILPFSVVSVYAQSIFFLKISKKFNF